MSFPEQTPDRARIESDALRRIAIGLGSAEEWRGAEDLEWIAKAIQEAGLPDPGSGLTITFYQEQASK